jgi:hypothetical protein
MNRRSTEAAQQSAGLKQTDSLCGKSAVRYAIAGPDFFHIHPHPVTGRIPTLQSIAGKRKSDAILGRRHKKVKANFLPSSSGYLLPWGKYRQYT